LKEEIMLEPSTVHNTFVIERNYPQPPDRVFGAFSDPARKRRWYAEGDHEIQEYEMDFRITGVERLRYRFREGHPIAGQEIFTRTTFEDIVPGKRIVIATTMTLSGKPISITLVTFEFLASGSGTDLILTNQGVFIDWAAGPAMLESGWGGLIDRIAKEVSG
jgi:uncharacterized protein YndB with AHSA1/START domain